MDTSANYVGVTFDVIIMVSTFFAFAGSEPREDMI